MKKSSKIKNKTNQSAIESFVERYDSDGCCIGFTSFGALLYSWLALMMSTSNALIIKIALTVGTIALGYWLFYPKQKGEDEKDIEKYRKDQKIKLIVIVILIIIAVYLFFMKGWGNPMDSDLE